MPSSTSFSLARVSATYSTRNSSATDACLSLSLARMVSRGWIIDLAEIHPPRTSSGLRTVPESFYPDHHGSYVCDPNLERSRWGIPALLDLWIVIIRTAFPISPAMPRLADVSLFADALQILNKSRQTLPMELTKRGGRNRAIVSDLQSAAHHLPARSK